MEQMTSRVESLYLNWILDKVVDDDTKEKYSDLFSILNSIKYTCVNDLDENWIVFVNELREQFYESSVLAKRYSWEYGGIVKPVSFLEFIIILAIKMEALVMQTPEYGDRTWKWFMTMIENSGLKEFDNGHFDEFKVAEKVLRIMGKCYESNGKGGLFVTKKCKFDLRKATWWEQANAFLVEFCLEDGEI